MNYLITSYKNKEQKEIIEDEGYATFSEGILSINLPINGTTVRFYKLQ